jgi:hypothetical protein
MAIALTALLALWSVSKTLRDGASVSTAAEPLPISLPGGELDASKGGPNLNPKNIEGDSLCVDCHRAEFAHLWSQWRESEHGWIGYSRLLGDRAAELAKDLGIETNQLTKNSVCIECHATPSLDYHGRMKPTLSVSCEACHNAAGGEDGWLNLHAAYGPPGTRRVDESAEHLRQRKQNSQQRGQLQSANIYTLVRRCYSCHIVGDETLITKTDHQVEDRDFSNIVGKLADEKIRHNFHLDQSENAPVASLWTDGHWHPERAVNLEQSVTNRKKMFYVASLLGRAETILRLMANASDPTTDYAADLGGLIDPGDVEDVLENVEMSDAEREDAESLVEAMEELELEDTAGDLDEDESLSDEERSAIRSVADRIERLGTSIAAGSGDNLSEVELP